MKTIVVSALILVSGIGLSFKTLTETWMPDNTKYSVKISSSKFEGIFKGLKTNIHFDETKPEQASIEASIEAETINTGNGLRNKHAKQGIEAAKYPTIRVVSTAISGKGNQFEFVGKLTIKETKRELKFLFQFMRLSPSEGLFNGTFTVKPSDFNIKKSGTPESFIVTLNIPVTK